MFEIHDSAIDDAIKEFPDLIEDIGPELENIVRTRVLLEVARRRRAQDPIGAQAIALVEEVLAEKPAKESDEDFLQTFEKVWQKTAKAS